MSESVLRGTSSTTRTMDAQQIAALRPATDKPKRARNPRREPLDRSRTYFCSNPQCDHATWSEHEQARHMAREFWAVARALVRLAPDSHEARELTGGVIMADLTDDECRAGEREYHRLSRRGELEAVPLEASLRYVEYMRRRKAGTLGPRLLNGVPIPDGKKRPHEMCGVDGKGPHPLSGDNLRIHSNGVRSCRECARTRRRRRYAEDPEFRARENARSRNASPERRAKRAAADRERWARLKEQAATAEPKE